MSNARNPRWIVDIDGYAWTLLRDDLYTLGGFTRRLGQIPTDGHLVELVVARGDR